MVKKIFYSLTILLGAYFNIFTQIKTDDFLESKNAYFNQKLPGEIPVLFAPDIVSVKERNEATISFSPDGKKCVFFIDKYPSSYAMYSEFKNGNWTKPETAWFSKARNVTEPVFSNDGKRIYFSSNEQKNSTGGWDLWYIELIDKIWSDPVNFGIFVNSPVDEYHPCIIDDGSIYFTDNNGNIAKCPFINDKFHERIILPDPINLKSNPYGKSWGDPYVSRDESYMIFKSKRQGGYGLNDIYISFRKKDGTWGEPKNMGDKINTSLDETAGDISFDGKYMFFGRGGDIYWVKADFIKKLR